MLLVHIVHSAFCSNHLLDRGADGTVPIVRQALLSASAVIDLSLEMTLI